MSLYPYFPVGYMSWMNQSAQYRPDLVGIIATCVTPTKRWPITSSTRISKTKPSFWPSKHPSPGKPTSKRSKVKAVCTHPTGVQQTELSKGDALYETPAAILQYRLRTPGRPSRAIPLYLWPGSDDAEIIALRAQYLGAEGFARAATEYAAYVAQGQGCLKIETPDPEFDNFVNHWLPRQVFYHGDVNRLTADPQTRNYLQDNMGMSYLKPQVARTAFLHALSQQETSGAMPDGILLFEGAELKYINQIPHTDHCVWLPVCLKAYLDETNDYGILQAQVNDREGHRRSVFERITNAMRWLLQARDRAA